MDGFSPSTPISLQIRKIIFEKFNDVDTVFTNDDIFEIIKQNADIDSNWIIDDLETYFNELCDRGLARNVAQNFTTMHFKLFDSVEKIHCNSCNRDVYLGSSEDKVCPNCKESI